MTSLGKSCYVGTLHYEKLVPPVSTLEQSFTTDTDIEKGDVVQLKSNGNIEKVEISSYTQLPQFPVAPYQAFIGTGGVPQAYTSVLFTDLNRCLVGWENTSARTLNIQYWDIDKTFPTPFSFNPVNVVYTASGSNNLDYQRTLLDEINADVDNPRGVCIYAESGTGSSVGTYIFAWTFNYTTNTATTGTSLQISTAPLDIDGVFTAEDKVCVISSDNKLSQFLVNWADPNKVITLNGTPANVSDSLTSITNPRINTFNTTTDTHVATFHTSTYVRVRPFIVGATDFTAGNESNNASFSIFIYAVSKKYNALTCYLTANLASPGIGYNTISYNDTTDTMDWGAGFTSLSAGTPMSVEYLELSGIGKLLVWFNEGYITNYPTAGFYNLDTASNNSYIITSSAPADFATLGVLQEDADVILAWQGTGDGRCALCNIGDAVGNLNADRIIGISKENKSVGQDVDVKLLGSVADVSPKISTLSPVSECYVQVDGNLTQVPATGEVSLGKALTNGEILLTTNPTAIP